MSNNAQLFCDNCRDIFSDTRMPMKGDQGCSHTICLQCLPKIGWQCPVCRMPSFYSPTVDVNLFLKTVVSKKELAKHLAEMEVDDLADVIRDVTDAREARNPRPPSPHAKKMKKCDGHQT